MRPAARERLERAAHVASAWGSMRAEGLEPTARAMHDADEYIAGRLSADAFLGQTIARYREGSGENPTS
jgi:Antitoxin VbhA